LNVKPFLVAAKPVAKQVGTLVATAVAEKGMEIVKDYLDKKKNGEKEAKKD